LAELLRERHRDDRLTVINADFEDAELTSESFDLVVAATSWHWVDAAVAVPKAASVLNPGGALVVWWTIFGDPQAPRNEFRSAIDSLCQRYLRPAPKPEPITEWLTRLRGGGLFTTVAVELIRWSQQLTATSAQALWATYPNVAELPVAERESFLGALGETVDALGGLVDDPRITIVYHTRRHISQPV
jgi:SAM-dependent methyltransferase